MGEDAVTVASPAARLATYALETAHRVLAASLKTHTAACLACHPACVLRWRSPGVAVSAGRLSRRKQGWWASCTWFFGNRT